MTDKFQNKYRIPSARMQTWDYRWNGAYFITICTKNRIHYFGEVVNNEMKLSNVGVLADVFWHEIKHHSKNLTFGEFIVMPNHIHGILIINSDSDIDHADGNPINNNPDSEVQKRHALSLRDADEYPNPDSHKIIHSDGNQNPDADGFRNPQQTIGQKRLRNPGKNSISSIIGGYKSAVTKHAHRLNLDFEWQTRFYDNIIRDERAFQTISNYIINNPTKWKEDKFRT